MRLLTTVRRLLPVALVLLTSTVAAAQTRSTTAGFFVGAHINGSSLQLDDVFDTEWGAGAGLLVGYGINKNWAVFANVDGARLRDENPGFVGNYRLAQLDLGARYTFGKPTQPVRPFAELAVTGRRFDAELNLFGITADTRWTGGGATIGTGADMFVSKSVAISLAGKLTFGKLGDLKINGVEQPSAESRGATSARLNAGVTWYPSAR